MVEPAGPPPTTRTSHSFMGIPVMVSSNITRPAVLFGVSCGAMTAYRRGLPQLRDEFFLTDGGIETTTDVLPHLRRAGAAVRHRADPRAPRGAPAPIWGKTLGYGAAEPAAANRRAIGSPDDPPGQLPG